MALLTHSVHGGAARRAMKAFLKWMVRIVPIVLFLFAGATWVWGQAAKDYDLKAVFLFNFAQFVEWPSESFADSKSPFIIGILGEDPFGKTLDKVVRDEVIRDRKIVVRRFARESEIEACHILFISKSKTGNLNEILGSLKGKPILTVGETDEFSSSGGMIGFVQNQGKIRLRINLDPVKESGLSISSKMLKTAEVIGTNLP